MAPVLQCPECGTKHPLGSFADRPSFPCTGCGRTLKVPEQVRVAPADTSISAGDAASAAGAPSHATAGGTHVSRTMTTALPEMPAVPIGPPRSSPVPAPPAGVGSSASMQRIDRPTLSIPSRPLRFLLWFVAVPLGFVIVFAVAKVIGVLNTNQITDVWLAEGWSRFVPIARLLPFVAFVTAALVHGGVVGITQLRERHRPPGASPELPVAQPIGTRVPASPDS